MMIHQSFILAFLSVTLFCFASLVEGKDTVHCSFDRDRCQWKERKGRHCWPVSQADQNLAGMTSYLYFNSSCSYAEILTKPMSGIFTEGEEEFHFWYYMHGEGEGELKIVDHDAFGSIFGNKPHESFHCKGDRGNQWYHGHVKIPSGATLMGIIAKTKGSFLIAIDNITADSDGQPVPPEQTCPPRRTTLRRTKKSTTATVQPTTSTKSLVTKNPSTKMSTAINAESSRPLITKSNLHVQSTTLSVDINTNKAITSAQQKGRYVTGLNLPNSGPNDTTAKGNSRKTSVIIGSCIGVVVVLVGAVLAGFFTFRRVRFTSMYSFKREKL